MRRQVLAITMCALVAILAQGCNGTGVGPRQSASMPTGSISPATTQPHGDGSIIAGTIVSMDEKGNLQTNIPARWIAADPSDKKPLEGPKLMLPEGHYLKIYLGGKEFPALFCCWKGGVSRDRWAVLWNHDDDLLRIVPNDPKAAKAAGAAKGAEVRLVKVGKPL